MANELRAVIYTRVSTEKQEDNTSLGDQRKRGLLYAQAREMVPVKVLEDAGISGTLYEGRPALAEALRMIETGQAQVLIVTKIDRLARKTKVLLDIAERVARAGGSIVTCDGMELGNTSIGRLMLTFFGAIAELERDTIRDRMEGGKRCRAEQGIQPSRAKSPYGYTIVTEPTKEDIQRGAIRPEAPGTYLVVEEEAERVREMFTRYDAGESLRGIAAWMEETGAPTPKGATQWRANSIRLILLNPVFKGTATFGRRTSVTGEHLTQKGNPDRKLACGRRFSLASEDNWTLIPVPAVVDALLWERVQVRLRGNVADKQAMLGGNPGRKYLLTGMAQCPICGRRMAGNMRKRANGRSLFYVCGQNQECANRYKLHAGDVLNDLALQALTCLAEQPQMVSEAVRAYEAHTRETDGQGQNTERLKAELAKVNSEIDASRRAMIRALQVGLREEDFLADMGRLAKTREKIEQQVQAADASTVRNAIGSATTVAEKVAAVSSSIVKVFRASEDDYSTSDKQRLLSRIIESVVPIEEGAEITLRSETVHFAQSKCFCTTFLLKEEKR